MPAFHWPIASLQQNAFEVVGLGDFEIGIPVALHDFPHKPFLKPKFSNFFHFFIYVKRFFKIYSIFSKYIGARIVAGRIGVVNRHSERVSVVA